MNRKQPLSLSESQIRKTCEDWLNINRWLWWPMPIGPVIRGKKDEKIWTKSPLKGFPDICGILKPLSGINPTPIFWAVEFKKSKGGKISEEQKFWHEKLRSNGVHILVADNVQNFIDWLSELQKYYYQKSEVKK